MAARGSPIPAGPAPHVAAVGQEDTPATPTPRAAPRAAPRPAPRPAPRRRRRPPAAPDFLVHRTTDDVLLLLPGGGLGGAPRPPRAPRAAPLRKRRRGGAERRGVAVGPQSPWGARLPPEILVRIFQAVVEREGALPFLCRAARVCRLWRDAAAAPRLWRRLSLGGSWGAPAPQPLPHGGETGLGLVRWLAQSRFCFLQEFALCGWKSHVGFVLEALAAARPPLASLALAACGGVPALPLARLPPHCPALRRLQLRHCQVEPTAVAGFLAAAPRLQQLRLSCGPRLAPVLAALASGRCPDLRLLELDAALGGSGPPLPLPIERLQAACPRLQVLRLLNLRWAPRPPPPGRPPPAPGFPRLAELSLAAPGTPGTPGLADGVLRRLLRASPALRLLDLRGCARLTPRALLELPCADLEQLYLGLPCGAEQLPRLAEGSAALARKWRHSLRELDLAGRDFAAEDLAWALAAFGPGSPLRSLNLAGTKVTAEALSGLLATCPALAYLNLTACRRLPRGTKRAHRGRREVCRCLRLLAGQPPGNEPPGNEPPGDDNEPLGDEPLGDEPFGDEPHREEPLEEEPPNEEPLNEGPPNRSPPQW